MKVQIAGAPTTDTDPGETAELKIGPIGILIGFEITQQMKRIDFVMDYYNINISFSHLIGI